MPSYEESLSEFERYDAQVLGVSTDSVPTLEAWAKSIGGLSYPLLSDFWPHGLVALRYACLRDSGVSERAVFVIDRNGRIAYVDVHDIRRAPPKEPIFDALRRLR